MRQGVLPAKVSDQGEQSVRQFPGRACCAVELCSRNTGNVRMGFDLMPGLPDIRLGPKCE
jgi:hypothetical protein